jgi:hypothetical protein
MEYLMTDVTTFPGLKNIDPIQGLVDYVLDIKPYHSKIFETLVEYVYTDYINVSIKDSLRTDIDSAFEDNVDATILESSITEMLDFFSTAPTPPTFAVASTDVTNLSVNLSGNQTNSVSIGDILNISGSTSNDGNYDVVSVTYLSGTNETSITLNSLAGSNGTDGNVMIFDSATTYNFAVNVTSNPTSYTATDPANATNTFTTPAFIVPGNVTRAIQAGSIFKANDVSGTDLGTFYAVFVLFIPYFDPTTGIQNRALDTSVIGYGLPANAPVNSPFVTGLVPAAVTLNPYFVTGYDDRYDAPFDQMAGYHIISAN